MYTVIACQPPPPLGVLNTLSVDGGGTTTLMSIGQYRRVGPVKKASQKEEDGIHMDTVVEAHI